MKISHVGCELEGSSGQRNEAQTTTSTNGNDDSKESASAGGSLGVGLGGVIVEWNNIWNYSVFNMETCVCLVCLCVCTIKSVAPELSCLR